MFKGTVHVTLTDLQVYDLQQCPDIVEISAYDPDPLDPQDFSFLDPDLDSQKCADPRIRIQGAEYQPKTAKIKNFTLKTQV